MAINREKTRASAQKHLQKGQLDKAIKDFERLVEDDPKDVRTLLKLGDLQTRAGDNANATQTFMRVAHFYAEQGFFLKAVAVYKQILKIDPTIIEVNVGLAELYQQLGLASDAIAQYRQLAQLFEQQNRIDDCVNVLRKMIESDGDNVASRVKLAEMYAKQNKLEDAKREFRESAAFLKRQQRLDDWVKVAERMVFFCPDDLATTRELADVYVRKGDARRALAKLQLCFKHDPRDTGTLALLASAFEALGQVGKAVSVYKELARVHDDDGDARAATEAMGRVLELAPDDEEAQRRLRGGDGGSAGSRAAPSPTPPLPPARSAATRRAGTPAATPVEATARPPASAATSRPGAGVARSSAAPGSDTPGAPRGQRAGDGSAEGVAKLLVEADIYIKYGLHPKAIEHVRKVLEVAPDSREAQEKLAGLLASAGDEQELVSHLLTMARSAMRRGESDAARADLEKLLGLDHDHLLARQLLHELRGGGAAGSGPEPEIDELEVDVDADGDVPSVVLEGVGSSLGVDFEPSPEAAEIDLDADDELLSELAAPRRSEHGTMAGGSASLAPRPAPPLDEPATATSGPVGRGAPMAAAPAPAAARHPGTTAGSSSSPAVSKRPSTSTSLTGIDDLDALLASAVPVRRGTSPAATSSGTSATPPAREPVLTARHDDDLELLAAPTGVEGARRAGAGLAGEAAAVDVAGDEQHPLVPVEIDIDVLGSAEEEEPAAATSGEERTEPPSTSDAEDEATGAPTPDDAAPVSDGGATQGWSELESDFDPEPGSAPGSELEPLSGSKSEPAGAIGEPLAPGAAVELSQPEATRLSEDDDGDEAMHIERVALADELADDLDAAAGDFQSSFTDVFDEFKKGVAEQVDDSDHQTHYDLAIAYREMGLIDDAIRELAIAQRSPEREIVALTMIGICYLERGDATSALDHFQRGLGSERATATEVVALRYEVARAYQSMGRPDDALKFYEKVQAGDPSFRDVVERIRDLREHGGDSAASGHELDELLADTVAERAGQQNGGKISYL